MARKPLLIIQTGTTIELLRPKYGDFSDWFVAALGPTSSDVIIRRVDLDEDLPKSAEVGGVIVTGSPAMVSDREPWSERTADWLADAVPSDLPILGVCYGHQLIAHALGGVVGPNPNGREIGTVKICLNGSNKSDPLLHDLEPYFWAQETHVESVLELPPAAVRLAESDLDENQAFRIGTSTWGLQFHPEFGPETLRSYVEYRRPILEEEGFDVDGLLEKIGQTPAAASILPRFLSFVYR